jgi:uncharacterized protein
MLLPLTLGILSSFHCVGMCGPIAMALPVVHRNEWSKAAGILLYNSGRVFTYAILGLLFGLMGEALFMAGIQQVLSITLGIVILSVVFIPKFFKNSSIFFDLKFFSALKPLLSETFRKKSYRSLFAAGVLNGLLPCGMVYLAIAGAIGSGTMLEGAVFMAFFGAGTVPVMFSLMVLKNQINISLRNKMRKAVPVFAVIFAALFILRGLNLDLPYLSPGFSSAENKAVKGCTMD